MKDILEFVNKAHQGQMRRQEEPYVNHVVRTSEMCAVLFNNESAVRVALLHDLVEDTDYGFEECFEYLQNQEEKEALRLLTKKLGESSEKYMKRLLGSKNIIALQVKACDAIDNSRFSEKGLEFTRDVLGLDPDQERLKYLRRAKLCLDRL